MSLEFLLIGDNKLAFRQTFSTLQESNSFYGVVFFPQKLGGFSLSLLSFASSLRVVLWLLAWLPVGTGDMLQLCCGSLTGWSSLVWSHQSASFLVQVQQDISHCMSVSLLSLVFLLINTCHSYNLFSISFLLVLLHADTSIHTYFRLILLFVLCIPTE